MQNINIKYRYFSFLSLKSQIILSHHSLISLSHLALYLIHPYSYQDQGEQLITIGAIRTVLECWKFYRRLKDSDEDILIFLVVHS